MTRNVERNYEPGNTSPNRFDLPAESYEMTIGGLDGTSATVSASDPLTGAVVPVQIVSRGADDIVVQMPVSDSPRLLMISDGAPALDRRGDRAGAASGPSCKFAPQSRAKIERGKDAGSKA